MSLSVPPLLAAALVLMMAAPAAFAQAAKPDPATVKTLAPSGRLRAAINLGNPILAQKDATTGELKGVSVVLAKALAKELGVPLDMIPYTEAGLTADGAAKGEWDVAFLARDPKRAETIAFTAPYVIIEGAYLVRADAPYRTSADLDRDGGKIVVNVGAAYDLYLTRALKHATLVRDPTAAGALKLFGADKSIDAAAGVGAVLDGYAKGKPELRVIHPGFQVIEQAMALPERSAAALPYAQAFVERMKASGAVRKGLDESGQADATVAPPAK